MQFLIFIAACVAFYLFAKQNPFDYKKEEVINKEIGK
jgi:hypothetical protein